MNTAIVYSSKYGFTKHMAQTLSQKLKSSDVVTLISLHDESNPDISSFDKIIIGSAIYRGKSAKEIKNFCQQNHDQLITKKIGLFVCGMETTIQGKELEMKRAFPDRLNNHATAHAFLGGSFQFEKMNLLERLVVRHVAKVKTSVTTTHQDEIDRFVTRMTNF